MAESLTRSLDYIPIGSLSAGCWLGREKEEQSVRVGGGEPRAREGEHASGSLALAAATQRQQSIQH